MCGVLVWVLRFFIPLFILIMYNDRQLSCMPERKRKRKEKQQEDGKKIENYFYPTTSGGCFQNRVCFQVLLPCEVACRDYDFLNQSGFV